MRIFKIVLYNILFCFIFILIIEYMFYFFHVKEMGFPFTQAYTYNSVTGIDKALKNFYIPYRTIFIDKKYTKKPILLFGCSYTYGYNLPEDKTFSVKLQKYTKRVVYNKAVPCWSIQHMLYLLRHGINKQIKNPEYIIYTFIYDHVRRLYVDCLPCIPFSVFYKYNDSTKTSLVQKTHNELLYRHSYTLRILKSKLYEYNMLANESDKLQFVKLHFLEAHKEMKKYYPESQFVIFVYDGDSFIKEIQEDLIDDGIKVIYLSELSSIDFKEQPYILDNYLHPSEKAWDIIVPLLSKKLNL